MKFLVSFAAVLAFSFPLSSMADTSTLAEITVQITAKVSEAQALAKKVALADVLSRPALLSAYNDFIDATYRTYSVELEGVGADDSAPAWDLLAQFPESKSVVEKITSIQEVLSPEAVTY